MLVNPGKYSFAYKIGIRDAKQNVYANPYTIGEDYDGYEDAQRDYKNEKNKPPIDMNWQNILIAHKLYGHIDKFWEFAKLTNYKYFNWGGRIFNTETGDYTGFLAEDIKS